MGEIPRGLRADFHRLVDRISGVNVVPIGFCFKKHWNQFLFCVRVCWCLSYLFTPFFFGNMEAMGGFISRKTWNVGRMGRKEKERTSNSNKNTTEKETHPKYVGKSDKTPSESNNDK